LGSGEPKYMDDSSHTGSEATAENNSALGDHHNIAVKGLIKKNTWSEN
jgi:hypothetical protein